MNQFFDRFALVPRHSQAEPGNENTGFFSRSAEPRDWHSQAEPGNENNEKNGFFSRSAEPRDWHSQAEPGNDNLRENGEGIVKLKKPGFWSELTIYQE